MNRVQRRLANKNNPKYSVKKSEIKSLAKKSFQEDVDRLKEEIYEEARIDFMVGALALPMMVLMDHFWTKSYAQKIPKFTEILLEYFHDWENGLLDSEKMEEKLWEYGGIKLLRDESV